MKHFKLLSVADGLVGSGKNISCVWLGLVQKFWVGLFLKKATSNSGRNESEAMFDKITNRVLFCNNDCEL